MALQTGATGWRLHAPLLNAASLRLFALMLIATLMGTGCTRWSKLSSRSYTTVSERSQEKATKAKQLNTQGLEALERSDLSKAEKLFGDALAVDVNYGPAHNNLGQVFLRQNKLYLAAWEFEFASQLLPERTESLINLGLVYETAGQLEIAQEHYEMAHARKPRDPEALANLARVTIKLDGDPDKIHWLLTELVMHDSRRQWSDWAKDLLAIKYRRPSPEQMPSQFPSVPTLNESFEISAPGPSLIEELPVPEPALTLPGMIEAIPMKFDAAKSNLQPLNFPPDLPQLPTVLPAGYTGAPKQGS